MRLDKAPTGQRFTVVAIHGHASPLRRRLMELGLTPGACVRVLGAAPLGDPVLLQVRGCALSLRRAQARQVEVVPVKER